MHMVVFNGTDGEEKWETHLSLKQKEYVAYGLAQYYQCDHCIDHHFKTICKLENEGYKALAKNVTSMMLFLRIDIADISEHESKQWIKSWNKFSLKIANSSDDDAIPHLIGLAIGIARNDDFLIQLCGSKITSIYDQHPIKIRKIVGELEAVVIFMKAAASKNRVVSSLNKLLSE